MTNKEVQLRLYGIMKNRIEEKRLNRDTNYTIYCSVQPEDKRVEIWDFNPLPGDPSKKERARQQKKAELAEFKAMKQHTDKALDVFRKAGLLN
jgi:hypothetical protein